MSKMPSIKGPPFTLVEQTTRASLQLSADFYRRKTPLLVKGMIADWPASRDWSFENFMALRRKNGAEVFTEIPDRESEQGATRDIRRLSVVPYLRALADAAAQPQPDAGLLTRARQGALAPGESFYLDWDYINAEAPPGLYLHQWDIFFANFRGSWAICGRGSCGTAGARPGNSYFSARRAPSPGSTTTFRATGFASCAGRRSSSCSSRNIRRR
jgi:hypothetical protein